MNRNTADVVVIGDGLIGLSTAYELALAGVSCWLVGARKPGAASTAAAGLLAPSVGRLSDAVAKFFTASLDRYPAFVQSLRDDDPELRLITGLVEISAGTDDAPQPPLGPGAVRLSPEALHQLEPGLHAPTGAVLHPRDGAIDNVRLVEALRRALDRLSVRQTSDETVERIDAKPDTASVRLTGGSTIDAGAVVLAAGAWSGRIGGLPRALPVTPLKGQMLALACRTLQHPVMGNDVYLVPIGDEVAVGATSEDAEFDVSTTPATIEKLRLAAIALYPALAGAPITRQWAGIRPATPDKLPIIGRDPDMPSLLYACGHSRNGILLAPATATAVTQLVRHESPTQDLSPFSIERFATQPVASDP